MRLLCSYPVKVLVIASPDKAESKFLRHFGRLIYFYTFPRIQLLRSLSSLLAQARLRPINSSVISA
jgi:hypothetical protein